MTQTECVYDAGENPTGETRAYYPWTNGAVQVRNVFPVPSVVTDGTRPDPDPQAFTREVKPTVGQFPFTKIPAISLPGISTSTSTTPKGAIQSGEKATTAINPLDSGC